MVDLHSATKRGAVTKRICVLLAQGFEETEAVAVIDVLRRAELDVVLIGLDKHLVRGSHGIVIEADQLLANASLLEWDLIYLPGGLPGAHFLRDNEHVQNLLRTQHASGRLVAAICAAPLALEKAGLLRGRRVTSHPSVRDQLVSVREYRQDRVVIDDNVITSRGAGTALELGFALVALLDGRESAERIRESMVAG
jgi:4-methyl-5(b-hydroxyethyl)-thiazole monophosphate biosynthesis